MRVSLALTVAMLAGCGGDQVQGQVNFNPDIDVDEEGPAISHTPIVEPQTFGREVLLDATVEDESGVFVVEVVYQQETAGAWTAKVMREVGNGYYQGEIKGGDVGSGGMRYFLRATDDWDNTACLPEDCEDEAWHFSVVPPQ